NLSVLAVALYFLSKGGVVTEASQPIDFKDFVVILLTALAVMIAIGALAIAALAAWTYREAMVLIEKAARETAKEIARDTAEVIATRIARETTPPETEPAPADEIARAPTEGGQK